MAIAFPDVGGFADAITTPGYAPPWHLGPVGRAYLSHWGSALNSLNFKMACAAEAHMPTKCDASCLPYIGDDRLMPQGATEPTNAYRVRLQQSLHFWSLFAGTPWGVIQGVLNVLAPVQPRVRHITNSGTWVTYEAGSALSQPPWVVLRNAPINFVWDTTYDANASTAWWRFWIVIFCTDTIWCSQDYTWAAGGTWDDGGAWDFYNGVVGGSGTIANPALFSAMRAAVQTIKSEHSWCRWIVVSYDDSLFDPWQTADGTHNPNGGFGAYSKIVNGQYVSSRFANATYISVP